jgi:hypothetical protein
MAARTAVVAGTATAVSGRVAHRQSERYAAQEQQQYAQQAYDQQQYEQQMAAQQPAAPQQDEQIAKLQELAQLNKQGVLSDEEFAAAKAKILGI